jgi:hypothetical protein
MGNIIFNTKAGEGEENWLSLSNGATSVLISVLILSGSDLASSDWEKELITWLAEKDQSVFGLGIVGFDIDDIAWDKNRFEEQKTFLLRTVDLAMERHRWNLLDYDPPYAIEYLKKFRTLVEDYREEFVEIGKEWDWYSKPQAFIKCSVHQVYMHDHGCMICNEQ